VRGPSGDPAVSAGPSPRPAGSGEAGSPVRAGSIWARLPERLQPRERERCGRGDLRRVESTLLVLAFILLAVAVVNDVVRETHVNERLAADARTWRTLTHHLDYQNVSDEQDLKNFTTRDVLCGDTQPGPPDARPQVCLIMTGPILGDGRRAARGGFYEPPYRPDVAANRYACFGSAVREGLCRLPTPPGYPDAPIRGADG